MAARNERKADLVYGAIDTSHGFYRGFAVPENRSLMNVCFNLANESLEHTFLSEAASHGLLGLSGHRSIGGIRASLYNAVSEASCQQLAAFMAEFQARHPSTPTSADAP